MRTYYETARGALERHGGMVEKFIGDAVVGMFGVHGGERGRRPASLPGGTSRSRASSSAVGEISVRIGINTGEVVAGDAARREMFASGGAVVLGDSVNVAARLEQAAAPGEILLGDATYRLVRDAVSVEPVEPVEAKGKSEPVVAHRLVEVHAPGRAQREASSTLVGRETELALLRGELEQAIGGGCRLVTVVGEPGVGKSRLARELLAGAGTDVRVTVGACPSYGEGISFWAIAQIVRDLAAIRDDHSAEQARERVPARIAQLLGLTEGTASAGQTARAVAEFLAAAAAGRPLVVAIDDLQWAEPALLDLLALLPGMVGDARVFLLCLARPELLEARPEWPVSVRVEPLGPAEVEALLDDLGAPAATRVRIALAAAGNPLYAEELVAWADEGGDLDALPTSRNAQLGARHDRLGVRERDALERGAIEGELFHQGAVVELSVEAARPAVPGELDQLTRKDLIRLSAASFAGELAYRFKHILVRDAAYRATTKKLRASLHERVADWLERSAGDRVGEYHEILGYHLEQAHRYRAELGTANPALAARAGHHLGAAGRRAAGRSDYATAESLLGRADFPSAPGRRRTPRVDAPLRLGDRPGRTNSRGRKDLRRSGRARDCAGQPGPGCTRSHYTWLRIFSDPAIDFDAARRTVEEGLRVMSEFGDETGLAEHSRQLGLINSQQGRYAEAAKWLERALVHAEACDDQLTLQRVGRSLAFVLEAGPMPAGSGGRALRGAVRAQPGRPDTRGNDRGPDLGAVHDDRRLRPGAGVRANRGPCFRQGRHHLRRARPEVHR